jgi:hypothetical protein
VSLESLSFILIKIEIMLKINIGINNIAKKTDIKFGVKYDASFTVILEFRLILKA